MTDRSLHITHPLTDEICDQITNELSKSIVADSIEDCIEEIMRAAYDKGFDDAIECIRKAGLAHYSALYEAQKDFYNKTWQLENNHD